MSRGRSRNQRLAQRLAHPEKYYKYNPEDVDVAKRFDDYVAAYNIALTRCNTKTSSWYVVPSHRKWYRSWVVAKLLVEAFGSLDLGWPAPSFDVETERHRVSALPENLPDRIRTR